MVLTTALYTVDAVKLCCCRTTVEFKLVVLMVSSVVAVVFKLESPMQWQR